MISMVAFVTPDEMSFTLFLYVLFISLMFSSQENLKINFVIVYLSGFKGK